MTARTIKQLTSRAYGWRLERRDGITFGFTSHDRDVDIDGITFSASPGMEPTSILQTEGLEAGGLDVTGALSSGAISEEDLRAGRWDRAGIEIFLFDWEFPQAEKIILASGELGSISYSSDAFESELLGLADLLSAPAVPVTSPSCRALFCDRDCGLSRHRFEYFAEVSVSSGKVLTFAAASPAAAGALRYGQLRFLSGANTGLNYNIVDNSLNDVELTEAIAAPITAPQKVLLIEGCDKVLETCAARFSNAVNFRGEAFLPGNDLLTRYPGAN